ncbi:hypothetical protein E2C01_047581 [Portunus trituberculatus]|uniref:Uncharacterized protein n=1 Tax=Portunus trituberculatus TaxID=210409 RepID=A0A5B7G407_PORTR|nr:hypothetical protein [Portunus trituberculatus]
MSCGTAAVGACSRASHRQTGRACGGADRCGYRCASLPASVSGSGSFSSARLPADTLGGSVGGLQKPGAEVAAASRGRDWVRGATSGHARWVGVSLGGHTCNRDHPRPARCDQDPCSLFPTPPHPSISYRTHSPPSLPHRRLPAALPPFAAGQHLLNEAKWEETKAFGVRRRLEQADRAITGTRTTPGLACPAPPFSFTNRAIDHRALEFSGESTSRSPSSPILAISSLRFPNLMFPHAPSLTLPLHSSLPSTHVQSPRHRLSVNAASLTPASLTPASLTLINLGQGDKRPWLISVSASVLQSETSSCGLRQQEHSPGGALLTCNSWPQETQECDHPVIRDLERDDEGDGEAIKRRSN